jgi:hypothetical protein
LVYENGDLRYIRHGAHEVLRRVYVAVRDCNWGTVPPQIENEHIEDNGDSFAISYDVTHRQGEIDFRWHGAISGERTAPSPSRWMAWRTRRLCATASAFACCIPLHAPVRAVVLKPVDGDTQESQLPLFIQPDAPLKT